MTKVEPAPPAEQIATGSDLPESWETREFSGTRSQRQQVVGRFRRHRPAVVALGIYAALLLGAFVGPYFYPHSYGDLDLAHKSAPPGTPGHILGTEELGRDLLAMIMRGVQHSTLICLIVVVLSGSLGVTVGAVAGFYGRWVDNALMRMVELLLSLPIIVVIVVVASGIPSARTTVGVAIILGAFGWMPLARIVRAEFLSLREREYIEAAHALGASDRRIIFRHLVPNSLGSIIVYLTLTVATAVLAEAGLTYLGYGVQGNDTSLGRLVSDGVNAADSRPWLFYFPGLVLMIIVLCVNLIGDGVRDAFDASAGPSGRS
ncbi:MAG TPA: ABC transporter permease [Mycobacteriales bacterium]|nr:ABC transporter permease [Mycobacteriales bacterium]